MLFSPETNSLLGLAGGIILISFFVLIGVSATIILHKTHKNCQLVRLTLEAECGGSMLEGQGPPSPIEQRIVENTSAYYSLSLCCQYVKVPNLSQLILGFLLSSYIRLGLFCFSSIFFCETQLFLEAI
jgi:hypothetical protein